MKKIGSALILTIVVAGFMLMGKFNIVARAEDNCEAFDMFGVSVKYCPEDDEDKDIVKYEGGQIVSVDTEYKSHLAWRRIFDKYEALVVGVWGLCLITVMGIFIKLFLKLGASASNPQARAQTLSGILWAGIGTALLGSAGIMFNLFYNAL